MLPRLRAAMDLQSALVVLIARELPRDSALTLS